MKKRRELDALVNNGKVGRRKVTKNGKHELLRSETDSSEVEFQLPAQKTAVIRKSRKRWHICGTCISVCAFFMITLCLLACGGLVWLQIGLRKELDSLRTKITSVETGNKDTPEALQTVHSKIQEINNKLDGENGLDKLGQKEDDMADKVKVLNTEVGKLSKSVSEASKMLALPGQVDELKQNVASVGASVRSLKDDVKNLQKLKDVYDEENKQIKKELEELKNQAPGVTSAGGPGSSDGDDPTYSTLQKNLKQVQNSLQNKITTLQDSIQGIQQVLATNISHRITAVEARLTSEPSVLMTSQPDGSNRVPPPAVDVHKIAQEVIEIVRANLTTKREESMSAPTLGSFRNISSRIALLEKRIEAHQATDTVPSGSVAPVVMDNFTAVFADVKKRLDALNKDHSQLIDDILSSNKTFQAVKHLVTQAATNYDAEGEQRDKVQEESIDKLNASVSSIKNQLQDHITRIATLEDEHNSITGRVSALEQDAAGNNEVDANAPNRPLHLVHIDDSGDLKTYFNIWDSDDDGFAAYDDLKKTLGIHMPPESRMALYDYNNDGKFTEYELACAMGFDTYTTPGPIDPTATTGVPIIKIDGISTKDDLKTNFYRWDVNGDGLVSLDDMPQFLGPNMPHKKYFKPYDFNNDDLYSLEEMEVAFGFPQDIIVPSTKAPTTVAQLKTTTIAPLVKIEITGINNEQDLKDMFEYWDKDRDSFVSIDELHDGTGDKIRSPTYIQPYDIDSDGRFSFEELMIAFGFSPVPEKIAQGRTQIPMSKLSVGSRKRRSTRKSSLLNRLFT